MYEIQVNIGKNPQVCSAEHIHMRNRQKDLKTPYLIWFTKQVHLDILCGLWLTLRQQLNYLSGISLHLG